MLEPKRMLGYYAEAMSLGSGPSVTFDSSQEQWTIPFVVAHEGLLGLDLTRSIMNAYSLRHPEVSFGERGIPLVFCLKMLVGYKEEEGQNAKPEPLLLIRGLLDPNGQMVLQSSEKPWIPYERMEGLSTANHIITVCDLDAYRAHQVALESLGPVTSWHDAITRAIDLFNAVADIDQDLLDASGKRVEGDMCLVRIWEHPNDAQAIAHALSSYCEELGTNGVEALSGPLRCFMGEKDVTPAGQDEISALSDEALLSYKLRCGMLDYPDPLGQADREILTTCVQHAPGALVRANAPLGTTGTALAVAAMANLLTEHALRGETAPAMACVGDVGQLEDLLAPFEKRPVVGQVTLPSRWLPRIANEGNDPQGQEHKILGALASPFILHSSDDISLSGGTSLPMQTYMHLSNSSAAHHCASWYVSQATIYYLDCVSGFLDKRVRSTDDAIALLSERLRIIDQYRCDLIDAYAAVCRADELVRSRNSVVAQLVSLRKDHRFCRERLGVWERALADHPSRNLRIASTSLNQEMLIARLAMPGEPMAAGCTTIDEVCANYRHEIERVEGEIDRLRGASATLARRARMVAPETGRSAELISLLNSLCKLSAPQRTLLESIVDGREVSFERMDALLDTTVRSAEFWLAMHINEAEWLKSCSEPGALLDLAREGGHGAWSVWAAFCPFALVPSGLAADAIMRHAGGEHGTAKSRLDLLILLNADKLNVPTGCALLGMANSVIAMGTHGSVGPVNPWGSIFDDLHGQPRFDEEDWRSLQSKRMTASGGASLYEALSCSESNPTCIELTDVRDAYGELCDARSDLFAQQRVCTLRSPNYSADDPSYSLAGLMPVLSYVLVPDSAWGQVGGSKNNYAESLALFRWLTNHGHELKGRFPRHGRAPICLLTAYRAQAALLRAQLEEKTEQHEVPGGLIEVCTLQDATTRRWPLVIFCATCGPDTINTDSSSGLAGVLDIALGSADDAFVLFCGGSWLRTSNAVAVTFLSRLARIGRLFSVPRKAPQQATGSGGSSTTLQIPNVTLREKPLSLTAMLRRMVQRGDIASLPDPAAVNQALANVGLIERVTDDGGRPGWRPTAAGREIGVVGTKDRTGHLFCSYNPSAEAVIARIADTLS